MMAGVFRHGLPGLFILVGWDERHVAHPILGHLQRFAGHQRHPQQLQAGLITDQADVRQVVIVVVGKPGDVRQGLPISQPWDGFGKQAVIWLSLCCFPLE